MAKAAKVARVGIGALSLLVMLGGDVDARPRGFEAEQRRNDRVAAAFEAHHDDVAATFAARGAAWPPRGLLLRAHKLEGELELWAEPRNGERFVLVKTFAVCAKSGGLGPKSTSGDLQVPEGVYRVDRFNPRSRFHLSLGIDYPNAVDRARAGSRAPGGDIFIHGGCATIGCLPLTDGPMEWLYVAAVLARAHGEKIAAHFFPCRFGEPACEAALLAEPAEHRAFWDSLRSVHAVFERTRTPPEVRIVSGDYRVTP